MYAFVETFFNISLMAGVFTAIVLVMRRLFKKAPKSLIMLMWALVAIRLLCPFTFKTQFGVLPEKVVAKQAIESEAEPQVVYMVMGKPAVTSQAPEHEPAVDPYKIVAAVWLTGAGTFLTVGIVSYLKLQKQIDAKIKVTDNIYVCDDIFSAFVTGIFSPMIILPSGLDSDSMKHVILHERMHLRHKDNFLKPLGFILLAFNWFNPLIWVAYITFCKDMELYCDECVIREYNKHETAAYSQALLNLSTTSHKSFAAVAFGEVSIGDRIKTIYTYRKPAEVLVIVCLTTMLVASTFFLTNNNTLAESIDQLTFESRKRLADLYVQTESKDKDVIEENAVNNVSYTDLLNNIELSGDKGPATEDLSENSSKTANWAQNESVSINGAFSGDYLTITSSVHTMSSEDKDVPSWGSIEFLRDASQILANKIYAKYGVTGSCAVYFDLSPRSDGSYYFVAYLDEIEKGLVISGIIVDSYCQIDKEPQDRILGFDDVSLLKNKDLYDNAIVYQVPNDPVTDDYSDYNFLLYVDVSQ